MYPARGPQSGQRAKMSVSDAPNAHVQDCPQERSTWPYCPLLHSTCHHFTPLLPTSYAAFPSCQVKTSLSLKIVAEARPAALSPFSPQQVVLCDFLLNYI